MQNDQQSPAQPQQPQPPQTPWQPQTSVRDQDLPVPESFGVPDGTPTPVVSVVSSSTPHRKWWMVVAIAVVVLALGAGGFWWMYSHKAAAPTAAKTSTVKKDSPAAAVKAEGLQLDTSKKYGDKYADGLLPVGDGHYSNDTPKAGYIYTCSQYSQSFGSDKGGAGTRGPWFTNNNTQYDLGKKAHIMGSVTWQPSFSNTVSGGTRTIATNDLPDHHTGTFPVAASDPAYVYDRNPNTIKTQTLNYSLTASPVYSATPHCMGGEAGVMLTGVALFNAFDAGGRDAGAWEVQDDCGGHPQVSGEYHYHTLSSCIKDIGVQTVIGYALDGFPITGPNVTAANILTTADLDECHGIVSAVRIDGKLTNTYHYVMTQDFPYSVSCFRATAADPPGRQGPPKT